MTAGVTLPLWLAVLLVLLAAWAALDRLLVPSVRWYLRRRVNRGTNNRTKCRKSLHKAQSSPICLRIFLSPFAGVLHADQGLCRPIPHHAFWTS